MPSPSTRGGELSNFWTDHWHNTANVLEIDLQLHFFQDRTPVEQEEAYLAHWEPPGNGLPPVLVHPCSKPFDQRENTRRELAELLNRVERHTKCTPAYCFRKVKNSQMQRCRFHFTRPLQDSSEMSNVLNPKWIIYNAVRNDFFMNKYNPTYILGWLTNVDESPCIDQRAILSYIAKHRIKPETKSLSYKDLLTALLDTVSSD